MDHYQSGTLETCLETLQEIDDISLSNTVKSQKRELEGMDKVRNMMQAALRLELVNSELIFHIR